MLTLFYNLECHNFRINFKQRFNIKISRKYFYVYFHALIPFFSFRVALGCLLKINATSKKLKKFAINECEMLPCCIGFHLYKLIFYSENSMRQIILFHKNFFF